MTFPIGWARQNATEVCVSLRWSGGVWSNWGSNEAPSPLSVTGQPLDGATVVVHVFHFRFHSSSPGCHRSTTLPRFLWGPVDCNFGDGVAIASYSFLVMMVSISSCWHRAKRSRLEMVLGQNDALDFPEACRVKERQLGKVMLGHPPAL